MYILRFRFHDQILQTKLSLKLKRIQIQGKKHNHFPTYRWDFILLFNEGIFSSRKLFFYADPVWKDLIAHRSKHKSQSLTLLKHHGGLLRHLEAVF